MNKLKQYKIPLAIGIVGILYAFTLLLQLPHTALGGAVVLGPIRSSDGDAAATSTGKTFMTPGTATTTIVIPTGSVIPTGNANSNATDQIGLLIMLKASSTNTALKWRVEYSDNKKDWYSTTQAINTNATTTQYTQTFADNSIVFASSTADSSLANGNNTLSLSATTTDTNFYHVSIQNIDAPYVRVQFFMPAWPAFPFQSTTSPSQNGAIEVKAVPKTTI